MLGKILIFILFILVTGCGQPKPPVLELGKSINTDKNEIIEATNTFEINDNIFYVFKDEAPFASDAVTRRIYKGDVYADLLQKESIDIKIEPGTKVISGSINAKEITAKFGTGDYMLLFIINNSVIAKKAFTVSVNKSVSSVASAIPKNNTSDKKIQSGNEVKPERMSPVSPGDMMNQ
jgi:hypothetical protein